jgi:hypothetical protein
MNEKRKPTHSVKQHPNAEGNLIDEESEDFIKVKTKRGFQFLQNGQEGRNIILLSMYLNG